MENTLLFSEYDIFRTIENQKQGINKKIEEIDSNRLLNTSTADLADYLYKQFKLDVPVLQKDRIAASQHETSIDVSNDRFHCIRAPWETGPFYVNGTEVNIEIPFIGDSVFFKIQPSSFSLNGPMGNTYNDKLVLTFTGTDLKPGQLKSSIDKEINDIEKWLSTLKSDVARFNSSLRGTITSKIENRKDKLLGAQNLVASLGFTLK